MFKDGRSVFTIIIIYYYLSVSVGSRLVSKSALIQLTGLSLHIFHFVLMTYTFPSIALKEILDSLAELYSLLQEEDMWAGLWQKRCKFPETATAIAYEQHGFFEQV